VSFQSRGEPVSIFPVQRRARPQTKNSGGPSSHPLFGLGFRVSGLESRASGLGFWGFGVQFLVQGGCRVRVEVGRA